MVKKFDVMKHELVPRHAILAEAEAKKILETYHIYPEQLPKILTSDPVVKAVKARPGQVLKIRRNSPTAGEAIVYRLVVEG
ncbi:MAG TPA: DNA-directed RNA polymerase subunit H [Candidatus Thermoplasmatota archaeon]|nr:DNA-directed RNA polymerase subunit H [Candidatus Thermoplasmatota archaeon]